MGTAAAASQQFMFGAGSSTYGNKAIYDTFGSTPGLNFMGQMYTNYRIRAIKVRQTAFNVSSGPYEPLQLYINAQADGTKDHPGKGGPVPPFVLPGQAQTGEQRWAKTAIIRNAQAGARPTTVSAYYSVNKVQGPDIMIKNDKDYTGQMQTATPFWDTSSIDGTAPRFSPWIQMGIYTLSGAPPDTEQKVTVSNRVTLYVEFFGKRAVVN